MSLEELIGSLFGAEVLDGLDSESPPMKHQ